MAGGLEAQDKAPAPESFDQLREALPEGGSPRAQMLERFARDSRAALSDRFLAISAWRRLVEKNSLDQSDVFILEAHLRAVGDAGGLRDKALKRAASLVRTELAVFEAAIEEAKAGRRKAGTKKGKRSAAEKKKERQERKALLKFAAEAKQRQPALAQRLADLEGVIEADASLTRLRRAVRKRARAHNRRPPDDKEATLVARLTERLPRYEALGDLRQQGEVQLALALFLEHTDAAREDVDRSLSRLVRLGGRDRDLARLRQKVRRARARVLVELGDYEAAVHESLVADRAMKVPIHKAAFTKPEVPAYGRSRKTAELCFAALARGVHCSQIEESGSGRLTFYDYSLERARRFNPERAKMALSEYQPLLLRCLSEQTKKGSLLSNTTIELEWSIGLNGRVSISSILPRRLRGTEVETCMQEAFKRFRYPRYRGEMQHMQLNFNIGE